MARDFLAAIDGIVARRLSAFRLIVVSRVDRGFFAVFENVTDSRQSENESGNLVEPMGFEPTTSSMPSRRAPNCATAPPGKNGC